MMRWGIVPWFAKTEDEFKALSTIKAKSDNLTSSKMRREPFAKRRCLVPASGLYEWPKPGHAISSTYEPESEPAIEEAGSGDFFGMSARPAERRQKHPGTAKWKTSGLRVADRLHASFAQCRTFVSFGG
jgi:hypothetical protein